MANERTPGMVAPGDVLIDVNRLVDDVTLEPDVNDPGQLVSFGTSGHRGTSAKGTFNDGHIAAITQAICEYREQAGLGGPLFLGKDTHALSAPAQNTALEVLVANGVDTVIRGRRFHADAGSIRGRFSRTIAGARRHCPMVL